MFNCLEIHYITNSISSTDLVKPTHFKYINTEDLNNTIYKFDLMNIQRNWTLITRIHILPKNS